ncbi:ERAD-associated E3 ubiquitin-protein ligase doa10 [Yarrowia sp. C11]|nr:ERAD-associated E3 ubiquitin-protein ligase doa10 [Yarrowia sp. C11]KAG5364131.1 ERAD-associated E3 ubiquitin-protein ligase doa10 [Yarrowia sp. E02]
MPKDIPLGLLSQQLSISVLKSTRTWLRYFMVAFMWLILFPMITSGFFFKIFKFTHQLFIEESLVDKISTFPLGRALLPQAFVSEGSIYSGLFVMTFEGLVITGAYLLTVIVPFFVREWVLNCFAFRQELDRIQEEDIKQRHAQAVADVVQRMGVPGLNEDVETVIDALNQFQQEQRNNVQHDRQELEQMRRMQEEINRREDQREQQARAAQREDDELAALAAAEDNTLMAFLGFTGPLKALWHATFTAYTLYFGFTVILLFSPYTIGRATMFTIEKNVDTINYCIDAIQGNFMKLLRAVFGPNWIPVSEELTSYNTKFYNPTTFGAHAFEVLVGYAFTASLIYLYMKITKPKLSVDAKQLLKLLEAIVKVVIMFGVELLVFPFCCGLLLHVSILPLFGNFTELWWERLTQFGMFPITNIVLHWIIGTFYMIQFARFVSMCRGQMRPGVLYFVRNPNDPSYQPVQEVLEKTMYFQFKRILISGGMYAVFIGLCIGVVTFAYQQLLSGEIGLLPLTMDISLGDFWLGKPFFHVGLHVCLSLWLSSQIAGTEIANYIWTQILKRTSALLCLSSFIFNDDQKSEQVPEGSFVRAPCSDSVSLRKSKNFFVEVTKDDVPLVPEKPAETETSGETDTDSTTTVNHIADAAGTETTATTENEEDAPPLTSSDYVVVYTPPQFRYRVLVLLCTIWICGALCITGLVAAPVLAGRFLYSTVLNNLWDEFSDIEAFSIGAPIVAGFYLVASTKSAAIASRFVLVFLSGVSLLIATSAACEMYVLRVVDIFMDSETSTVGRAISTGFMVLVAAKYVPSLHIPVIGPLFTQTFANGIRTCDLKALSKLMITSTALSLLVVALPAMVGLVLDGFFHTHFIHIGIYPVILALSIVPIVWGQVSQYLQLYECQIRDKLYMTGEKLHNRE